MNRCKICVMPDTRPDTEFVDGVCSACIAYQKRPAIDWALREIELNNLLSRHRIAGREFDCIVPSSGGKDSTYQVLKLIELGAKPLVVTATTCMLTDIGRKNIDNLARYATTIEVSPNKTVRAKLNRLGLEMVGDISWPEHVAIFTTPFKIAVQMGIPLIFYGENPQNQYGGPMDSQDSKTMTRRWVSEFGGFLGLRPADLIGNMGITRKDMQDYMPPDPQDIDRIGVEAHFLGQYLPWDSHENVRVAKQGGMIYPAHGPSKANWWPAENLDNVMTGIHDHMMYRKYGYGRGCAQISVDVRAGIISRGDALVWARDHDGLFPWEYMGVSHMEVLKHIGIADNELVKIMDQFTAWELFDGSNDRRPILK
jgi:N-acetyl sugar amidotransferase